MEHPARFVPHRLSTVVLAVLAATLTGCAYTPRLSGPVDLDSRPAEFNHGRVTVVLIDEYGSPMPGYMVDFTWDKPNFYKTSAFTDRNGHVTFTGVPDTATVSINHDAGLYERVLLVPQSGSSELRVMVDTLGAFEQKRQAENARLMGYRSQQ